MTLKAHSRDETREKLRSAAGDALVDMWRLKTEAVLLSEGDWIAGNGERVPMADRLDLRRRTMSALLSVSRMGLEQEKAGDTHQRLIAGEVAVLAALKDLSEALEKAEVWDLFKCDGGAMPTSCQAAGQPRRTRFDVPAKKPSARR